MCDREEGAVGGVRPVDHARPLGLCSGALVLICCCPGFSSPPCWPGSPLLSAASRARPLSSSLVTFDSWTSLMASFGQRLVFLLSCVV